MQETKTTFLVLLMLMGLLAVSSPLAPSSGAVRGGVKEAPHFPAAVLAPVSRPQAKADLEELALSAQAVLARERKVGVSLYEKNTRERVSMASLTKLLTAVLVKQLMPPEKVVEILPEDLAVPGPRAELVSGEHITVSELLKAMLISSANDATMALARSTGGTVENFVAMMNGETRRLLMRDTAFTNPVGFDEEGHYSTAEDLAKLVEEFLTYPELVEISGTKAAVVASVDGHIRHRVVTTNRLLQEYPEVLGLKTGYTEQAKGNLVILVDESLGGLSSPAQYYYIILGSDDREKEGKAVLTWIKENFTWTPLEIDHSTGENKLP